MDVGGRRDVEARRDLAAFDDRVVADHRAVTDRAVEQHRVEADEHAVADEAGAVNDRAIRERASLADGDAAARLAVDDHAVLDVGIGTDDDRLHVAGFVHFVGANDRVGADENVFLDDDLAAQDGGGVDEGGVMDDGQMSGRVSANHDGVSVYSGCTKSRVMPRLFDDTTLSQRLPGRGLLGYADGRGVGGVLLPVLVDPLVQGGQHRPGADDQRQREYAVADPLEDLHGRLGQRLDQAELAEVAGDVEEAREQHGQHDDRHRELDLVVLHIGGADGADLDAEQRAQQDQHREADVDHALETVEDGAAEAHDEGDDEFGRRRHDRRHAQDVDHRRHADEAADRDRRGEEAGGEADRNEEQDRDPRLRALRVDHGAGDVHRLHPARQLGERGGLFAAVAGVVERLQLAVVLQHEPADDGEGDDEHAGHIEVGADRTEAVLDVGHHVLAEQHPGFGEQAENQSEFHIHLAVLVALDRADQCLGKLVADVGGDRDDAVRAQRHHRRGQN